MGETVIAAVVALLLQLYAVPPPAVRVMLLPLQIVAVAGLMEAVGFWFTFTVPVAVAVQLLALVTVTV